MFELTRTTLFLLVVGTFALLLAQASFFREGFTAGQPGVRCGVDLPGCPGGKSCLNGFCQRVETPAVMPNELPIYP
jgi:hypothetical protein